MNRLNVTRRAAIFGALVLTATSRIAFADSPLSISVLKDPNCGCCEFWARILQDEGFDVEVTHLAPGEISRRKVELGVPLEMASCHTALIEDYVIEGHVPVADIRRLLDERPDAVGIAVPGMPYGSPGMGPEDERQAYDVYLIGRDGEASVFTSYEAGENA